MNNAYGMLYVAAGAAAQAITSTPAKLTGWATLGPTSATGGPDGGDQGVVPVLASDKITVKPGGVYRVSVHFGGSHSVAADVTIQLYKNTTAVAQGKGVSNFAASNVKNYVGFNTIVDLSAETADVDLSVYGSCSSDGSITPIDGAFIVERIA